MADDDKPLPRLEQIRRVADEIRSSAGYPSPPQRNSNADPPQSEIGSVLNSTDLHPPPRAGSVELGRATTWIDPQYDERLGPGMEHGASLRHALSWETEQRIAQTERERQAREAQQDLRLDLTAVAEAQERRSPEKANVADSQPTPVAGHDPLPKDWIEAVPLVLFGFYGLAFAFEAVGAVNRGNIWIAITNTVGCIICAGIALAWWKRKDWLPQRLVETTTLVVTDARWLIAAMSTLLIIGALSPYVEQRRWPFAWRQLEHTAAVPPPGGVVNSFNPSPQNDGPISWQQPFQLMTLGTANGGTEIAGLYFQGISNAQIQMKEAYIVSDLTGHREELKANVQYKGLFPVDQVDIPTDASVDLTYTWKPSLSVRDFLDQWGKFRFIAVYNGVTYEKLYDENFMRGFIQIRIPGVIGPRMTPKARRAD